MVDNFRRRASRARTRALSRLAQLHPDEFARLHVEERAREGLDPPDPSRAGFPGRDDVDTDEIVRLRASGLSLRAIAARVGVSHEAVRKRLSEG